MNAVALALIDRARRRGVRLVFSRDRWRYRGPAEALALVQETADTALEVLRRAGLFQEQVAAWAESGRAVAPTLALPDAPSPCAGACVSCGVPVGPAGWRCELCRHAVELALDLAPVAVDDEAAR